MHLMAYKAKKATNTQPPHQDLPVGADIGVGLSVADVPPPPLANNSNVDSRRNRRKKTYVAIEDGDEGVLQVDGNISLVDGIILDHFLPFFAIYPNFSSIFHSY